METTLDDGDELDKALAKIRAGQPSQQGAPGAPDMDAALARIRSGAAAASPAHDYHAEYASGALAKRMQGANARESANVAEDAAAQPGYGERLATHALNTAQGIPGVAAVEAGAGALGSQATAHPMTYRQSFDALHDATGQIGGKTAIAERLAGSVATLPFLPASPIAAGATLGGADQALSGDPGQSLVGRAARTVAGAAGGALLGKVGETAVTGARALMAGNPSANLIARAAERAASAKRLYGAALQEGQGKLATAAVQRFLASSDIAPIVDEIAQTRPFDGVARDGPEMLDQVYKTLSDQAAIVKKGKLALTPNRVNIGNLKGKDIQAAQSSLLDAMEAPGSRTVQTPAITTAQSPPPSLREGLDNFWTRQGLAAVRPMGTTEQQMARQALERHGAETIVSPSLSGHPGPSSMTETTPGVMPSYRAATTDFAARSGQMDALRRGYDAVRTTASGDLPTGKNLLRTTAPAYADWARTAPPDQSQAAQEGLLGAVQMALRSHPLTAGRRALATAPSLLRATGTPTQSLLDLLMQSGLLTANAVHRP